MELKIFTTSGYWMIVPVSQLLFFHRTEGITYLHLLNGEQHRIQVSLKAVEAQLNSPYFFRCHASYLVAMNHITQIDKINGYVLILKGNVSVPVATCQRALLLARLKVLYPGP